jgi:hypothetical protein
MRVPDWSFEHAAGWSVRRVVGMWLRLFKPRKFWDRFPIEAPVRRGRLIGFALVCMGLVAGLVTARLVGWAAFEYTIDPMAIPRSASGLASFVWMYLKQTWPLMMTAPTLWLVWVISLSFPLLVATLMPVTFAMSNVRTSQVLRCGAYSLTIPATGVVVLLVLELLDVGLGLPLDWYWDQHRAVFPLGHVIWLAWWWHAALKRYLKLPGAGKILFWHGTAACLAGLAVATRLLGLSL